VAIEVEAARRGELGLAALALDRGVVAVEQQ
jgi:hypothetical protein